MKVLITGGMGFIGRAVTKKLIESSVNSITIVDPLTEKIHGPDAKPFDFMNPMVNFIKGDISDRAVIEPLLLSADAVIHLAAETGTGQSMYEIELYNKVNITATSLMLDILSNNKHKIKKFLVASSRAIYGEGKYTCNQHGAVYPNARLDKDMSKGDFEVKCPFCATNCNVEATTEDSLIHPSSFYGITKHFQESIVMTMCPNIGIAPVALRYQNVYGPGQSLNNPYTGILSIFSNLLRAGKNIEIFEDGQESRDFVFIEDVADATAASLLNEKANNQILNIGSGVSTSVIDVANTLKMLYGSSSKLSVNGKYRIGDIRHNFADISRAKEAIGFTPRYDFKNGIKCFTDWVNTQEVKSDDSYKRSLEEMKQKNLYK